MGAAAQLSDRFAECVERAKARASIVDNVLRPARPRYAEAQAIKAEYEDRARRTLTALRRAHVGAHDAAQALWETFAAKGLIPDAWVDDAGRRFEGERQELSHDGGLRFTPAMFPHPSTVEDAVLFAADAEAIARVELLARETVRRMPRLDPCRVVQWRIDLIGAMSFQRWWPHLPQTQAMNGLFVNRETYDWTWPEVDRAFIASARSTAGVNTYHPVVAQQREAAVVLVCDALWEVAASEGLAPEGDNPFAPAVEILQHGYALMAVHAPRDAMRLLMPREKLPVR